MLTWIKLIFGLISKAITIFDRERLIGIGKKLGNVERLEEMEKRHAERKAVEDSTDGLSPDERERWLRGKPDCN